MHSATSTDPDICLLLAATASSVRLSVPAAARALRLLHRAQVQVSNLQHCGADQNPSEPIHR